MKQQGKLKARTLILCLVVLGGLQMQGCAKPNARFEKTMQEENSFAISQSTDSEEIIVKTDDEESGPVKEIPPPAPFEELPAISIEGWASGVASTVNPGQWESWAQRGTTIQLHYTLAGQNSLSTAMQIVKAGSIVKLGEALDPSAMATDEQGKPYAMTQYFNLATEQGAYTFNLPLRMKLNSAASEQVLKVGKYSIYLTACTNSKLASCRMSKAIHFEVR